MSELSCAVKQKGCKNKVAYVCHHCGRGLCSGNQCCKWGFDSDFAGWTIAYHCPACAKKYRLNLVPQEIMNFWDTHVKKVIKRINFLRKGKYVH